MNNYPNGAEQYLNQLWNKEHELELAEAAEENLNFRIKESAGDKGLFVKGFVLASVQSGYEFSDCELNDVWEYYLTDVELKLNEGFGISYDEYPYDNSDFFGDEY